jgi:hypothetical protein
VKQEDRPAREGIPVLQGREEVNETRIRWEPNGHSAFLGYVGTLTDSDWLFQVWRLDAVTGTWRLSSSLAGQFGWDLDHDGPDELKAEAERWLERFVASLGAVLPDPKRRREIADRIDQIIGWAKDGRGDDYYVMDREKVDRMREDIITYAFREAGPVTAARED